MTERTLREKIEALRDNVPMHRPAQRLGHDQALDAILALLDAHTAEQPVQCCMCGKTGLSTAEGDGGPECQLDDGRWTCSRDCWDRATAQPAPDAVAELADQIEHALKYNAKIVDVLNLLAKAVLTLRSVAKGPSA